MSLRAALAARFLALALALGAVSGVALAAPQFPTLTSRVTDAANVIPPDVESRLEGKLAALETQSQRQFVIATVPSLQGYEISDYGYQLGRAWGLGDKARNDGALLIVAPVEKKLRIEVGYGLEPVLTDGFSSDVITNIIVPRFKAGDLPGGIEAGTEAVIRQLQLPPEEAAKVARQADSTAQQETESGNVLPLLFFAAIVFFVFVLPILRAIFGGRGRRRRHDSGLGPVILWGVADAMARGGSSGGSFGGGGFGGGGFGGGGFSGGGGSFGGGGASGSW